MANEKYSYVTTNSDASLGQIERGLGLLGFRVSEADISGGDVNTGEPFMYRVIFEPGRIGSIGIKGSDSKITQLQGKIEEAGYATAG